jgi:tetratricopeptide (TPR) repeat protein
VLQAPQDSLHRRAEALLDAGELRDARVLLEDRLKREPRDVGALTLLGRVHLAWPIVGRWEALRLFRLAAEIAPDDPAPWYWKIRVGTYLGSADGEALMRSGLLGVLERDPRYRDVWEYWDGVYRNPDFLLSAADILTRHADDPGVAVQRARLLVDAGAYAEADAAIAALPREMQNDGGVWALKAQAALERGDSINGLAWYEEAVRRAARDSLQILWHQVAPIAWPDEDSTYTTLDPAARVTFFRAFWARREPDLNTDPNERIVEHFSRLRTARARFRLLHPQSRFHYSLERRTILGAQSGRVLQAIQQDFDFFVSGVVPGRSRFEDIIQGAGLGVDVRDLPEPDSITRYRRYGFDGRGLIYLRFGEPAQQLVSNAFGVEAWDYEVNGTRTRVTFARASTDGGGDMVLFPTNQVELHNSAIMLERDASSLAANADLYAWVAFFRGGLAGEQLAYVGVSADTSAAAVWDESWIETQRTRGRGPHRFTLTRGPYVLGVDAIDGETRGRVRAEIEVPNLWHGSLTLSSLLIGPARDTSEYTRDDVAQVMPGDRRFRAGEPLALYAEVYGLSADRDGMSRYQVQYAFDPDDGGRLVSLSYDRTARASDVTLERVVVQPGRIPPGRYRLRLTVWDQVRRRVTQSTFVPFELH